MKPTALFFLSLLFTGYSLRAQTIDTIKVNTSKQEIRFAKYTITSATTIEDIIKLLGPAERVEQIGGRDRHYVYDKLGISFDAGRKGLAEMLTINYNHDGDKKAAKEKYTHALLIDKFSGSEQMKVDDIKQNTSIKEIVCMGPSMCVSNPKNAGMALMIGYTDKSLVTQISFIFNNQAQ